MRVALDAQLSVGTATGIGEYVSGLYATLRRHGVDAVELKAEALDPWRFDRRVLWDQIALPQRARASGAQLLHCASGTMPLAAPLPCVVTVHDVAWLHAQSHAPPYARWYFGAFSLARYRRARRIVADSAYSRGALSAALGDDAPAIDVVYPGVAREYCELTRERSDGRTILAVGTIEPRKNLALLVEALPHLEGARLVAVGPPTPYAGECAALAERLGVAERCDLRGYVTRDELIGLYRTAAVVAVPSRYEGFGYAAAQALCAGVPCVVSDRTSLPEIVGNDAPVVPGEDPAVWLEPLRSALRGESDERAAGARGGAIARFSWDAAAEAMTRIYAAALGVAAQ